MKLLKFMIITLTISLFASPLFSQNEGEKKDDTKETSIKIIFLPFYDYTGTSMKYLSLYIPELIKERISVQEGIAIYDSAVLKKKISGRKLTPEMLYDNKISMDLLNELNAYIGIMGRYIIIGKTIKIDYHVLYVKSGKVVAGSPFEGIVDDNIMNTMERFADNSSEWLKVQAMEDIISKIEEKKKVWYKEWYYNVKKSKFGIIFTNKWLFALFILLSFYFISRIMVLFFEKVLKRLASKSDTTVDDDLIAVSKKPVKWILIFIGLKLALIPLGLTVKTSLLLSNFTTAFIIAFITYIVFKGSEILIHFWGAKVAEKIESRIDDDLIPLFVKIAKIFIAAMGSLLILSKFGIEIGPLVASLGIAGFAIGFAVKDSLSNVIGGIVLILDKSFVVGDKVTIDDDTGIIMEVGLRNTKLQTFDNEIIVIPNGELMNKKFKNYVLPDPKIRVVVLFSVAYGTDVDMVEKVIMKVIDGIDDVATDPAPAVVFYEMADFSLNFQAKFWIPAFENQYGKKMEATKKIYNALNDAKINIPFPTHTVYVEKE